MKVFHLSNVSVRNTRSKWPKRSEILVPLCKSYPGSFHKNSPYLWELN